mgnify:CR=1 FL=1
MSKLTCSLVLLALLGLGMVPSSANAGEFVVYFDEAGTVRSTDAGPVGSIVTMWVYGEGFEGDVPFVSGAQFAVDYAPSITWLADVPLYGAFIGNTKDGYSVGFGFNPQFGEKFKIVKVLGLWAAECSAGLNVNGPITMEHPLFPDPTPVISRFPDQATFPAGSARSQTCQFVEMTIQPCGLNTKWFERGITAAGAVVTVAVLGSETVDVNDVDPATILLEGVAPKQWSYDDYATLDGDVCACNDAMGDGYMDLKLKFYRVDLAAAVMGMPHDVGDVLSLTLTGAYWDGMPFSATDCIAIVGNPSSKDKPSGAAGLGFPTPNPFNPVTRISYNVPTTQHVRIAIYDVAGRLVEDLVNETKAAGEHVVEWDAARLPSGVYFYRMQTGDQTIVRRATLLK